MMKRVLSLSLALLMVLAFVPVTAFAGGEFSGAFEIIYFLPKSEGAAPINHEYRPGRSVTVNSPDGQLVPDDELEFVLTMPNGEQITLLGMLDSLSTSDGASYKTVDGESVDCVTWKYRFYDALSQIGEPGKYTLETYPAFEGYQAFSVSGSVNGLGGGETGLNGFTISDETGDIDIKINIYLESTAVGTEPPAGDTEEPQPPAELVAIPSNQAVLVNGEAVAFDAYNIEGSNYFKLRDLAFVLNGTEKQFEVSWEAETATILLLSGQEYTPDGSEMAPKGDVEKTPVVPTLTVKLDGDIIELTAYNIDGNNYFKIRDLGTAMGIFVDYDDVARAVIIDTAE